MKISIKLQLSLMMFLQFFIWGGWFVTLGTFLSNNLKASGGQIAMAFSTQSWGAIIAPVFIGLIADRYFNAEKILGVLHLLGSVLLYLMSQTVDFSVFYPYVFGYMLVYMPTLGLGQFGFLQSNERHSCRISHHTNLWYHRLDYFGHYYQLYFRLGRPRIYRSR
jgi:MFS family permease